MKDNIKEFYKFKIPKFFKINNYEYLGNNDKVKCFIYLKISVIILIFCIIQWAVIYFVKLNFFSSVPNNKDNSESIQIKIFDKNFEYHNYERELISEKIKKYAGYMQTDNEPYFLNGIIRKFKPKRCLEIGVARGGSSIIILNALKDDNNSVLISLDLNKNLFGNQTIGYTVKKYFSELTFNKWQLYTGQQPHKFLSKMNMTFDFLFLDTLHLAPGELINIIEALPFLEDNAIVVLHDIAFHFPSNNYYKYKSKKFHPSQIYLMTALIGDKIIIPSLKKGIENIGAVILYPNQEKYYLNYFLLLLSPWEYLPKESFIEELRIFIKNYYKNEVYLHLFDRSIEENRIYTQKYKNLK